jgi:nitrate reductase delta subunit
MNPGTCDLLAVLLAYPCDETKVAVDRCRTRLRSEAPEAVAPLDRFAEQTFSMTTEELQELYTQTFDLNPTCSLEVGWHLYGENYSRGEFLVAMRQTLRRLKVMETTELPDHLTHVLAAFGRMDTAEAGRFGAEFLLPALEKMLQGLKGGPYKAVLEAINAAIRAVCPIESAREGPRKGCCSLPMIDPSPEVCHG